MTPVARMLFKVTALVFFAGIALALLLGYGVGARPESTAIWYVTLLLVLVLVPASLVAWLVEVVARR